MIMSMMVVEGTDSPNHPVVHFPSIFCLDVLKILQIVKCR